MAKSPKPSPQERAWRAQDALHVLARAQEIQKDKGLMSDVKKHVQTLAKVAGPAPRKPTKKSK